MTTDGSEIRSASSLAQISALTCSLFFSLKSFVSRPLEFLKSLEGKSVGKHEDRRHHDSSHAPVYINPLIQKLACRPQVLRQLQESIDYLPFRPMHITFMHYADQGLGLLL